MILRGYYYGFDEEADAHVVHVQAFPQLGKRGVPHELRIPRSSYREDPALGDPRFGDEVEVELRRGHTPVSDKELPAPLARRAEALRVR